MKKSFTVKTGAEKEGSCPVMPAGVPLRIKQKKM